MDAQVVALTRRRAVTVTRRFGRPQDWEDVSQQMLLHIWEAEQKGWEPYQVLRLSELKALAHVYGDPRVEHTERHTVYLDDLSDMMTTSPRHLDELALVKRRLACFSMTGCQAEGIRVLLETGGWVRSQASVACAARRMLDRINKGKTFRRPSFPCRCPDGKERSAMQHTASDGEVTYKVNVFIGGTRQQVTVVGRLVEEPGQRLPRFVPHGKNAAYLCGREE